MSEDTWRTKDLVGGERVAILGPGTVAIADVDSVSKKYIHVHGLRYHREGGVCADPFPYVLADPRGFEARRRLAEAGRRAGLYAVEKALDGLRRAPRSERAVDMLAAAVEAYRGLIDPE